MSGLSSWTELHQYSSILVSQWVTYLQAERNVSFLVLVRSTPPLGLDMFAHPLWFLSLLPVFLPLRLMGQLLCRIKTECLSVRVVAPECPAPDGTEA